MVRPARTGIGPVPGFTVSGFRFMRLWRRTVCKLATALLHPAMNTTAHFLPMTVGGIILPGGFVICAVVHDRMWRRQADCAPGER
jgi:hypothetical protein